MNTTPIEKCSIGADAEYDVRIAKSKGWSEFEIYPNGNLIGTSPAGTKYEPVPQYAEMLKEAAPDLLAALKPFADYFEGDLSDVGGGTMVAPPFLLQRFKDAKAAIVRATGENTEKGK